MALVLLLTHCRLCLFPVAATGHKRLSFWRLLLYGLLACTSLRHDTSRLCHAPTLSRLPSLLWCKICATLSFVCSLLGCCSATKAKKIQHTHTHSLKYLKNKNNIKEQKERSGGRERGSGACRGKYLIKQRHVVGGRFRRHFLHMQRRLCCLLHLLPPHLFFCDYGFWFSFVCLASRLPPLLASSCQCWQTMRRAATLKVSFGAQRVASRCKYANCMNLFLLLPRFHFRF